MNFEEQALRLAEIIVNRLDEEQIKQLLVIQLATDLIEEDLEDPQYQNLLKYIKRKVKK